MLFQPFCEGDYLNTLEKCCKCTQPILDRILRATGKPYHPQVSEFPQGVNQSYNRGPFYADNLKPTIRFVVKKKEKKKVTFEMLLMDDYLL